MAEITIAKGELNKLYEDALLGFIVADPEKLLEVSEILNSPEYFADPNNRAAYEVFLKLLKEDRFPGAPALLIPELYNGTGKQHFTSEDEAARYVSALLDAPTVNAEKFNPREFVAYADHIKWEKDKRDIQSVGAEMISSSEKVGVADKEEFLSGIEDSISDITMRVHGKDSLMHISDITGGLAEQLDKLRRGETLGGGISTGIDMLDKTLNGLKGGELAVLAARPAVGKATLECTPILKLGKYEYPELTTIGELEVGDYVYNRHGEPVMVTGVFPQGKLEAYEMTFSDGRKVTCSADHIWPYWQRTHRKGKSVEVINNMTLKEMMDRGIYEIKPHEKDDPSRRKRSRFAMPINDPVEFEEREHCISPYVMGVFLGDGCKNIEANFVLSSEFEYHVAEIAEQLGAGGYKRQRGSYSWTFVNPNRSTPSSRLKVRDIDPEYEVLLTDTYCGDKYIPEEYLYDSIENRWELLRGLMDTDGSITSNDPWRHPITYSTTSKQMAYGFRTLCNSLGLIAAIGERDRSGQEHVGPNGKIYVRKGIEYTVSLLVPAEIKPKFFTIKHKHALAVEAAEHGQTRDSKYDRIRLKNVEKLPEKQEMVCISVDDPEELYLCNDFLVTHNTTLSMQIAYNVSQTLTDNKPNAVLIFSLEMMEDQLMSRMIATSGRINMQAFMEEYGHLNDDHYYEKTYSKSFEDKMQKKLDIQMERARLAMDHIETLPIYTSTEAGMSPNSIKSLTMQKKREIERNGEHLALIVIDYLQLMVPGLAKSNASRTEEVGDMSRKMKLLAKEFEVPVLLLAQLNRNADVTERPNLKDLRESGSIEQDADKVMFIWSENADKSPQDFAEYRDDAAKAEAWRREQMKVTITVAKNRQGETGDCPVIFDKGFQTYLSQSSEYAANNEQYEEFAAKYYQKTRTSDLFWPLKEGEIPEEFERFRNPVIREAPYLTPDGQLLTIANDAENKSAKMHVATNTYTNANQNVSAGSAEQDRSTPAPLPEIDDMEAGFEELPEEELPEEEHSEVSNEVASAPDTAPDKGTDDVSGKVAPPAPEEADEGSDIVLDDDDDTPLDLDDLDDLDVLTALSEELKG